MERVLIYIIYDSIKIKTIEIRVATPDWITNNDQTYSVFRHHGGPA